MHILIVTNLDDLPEIPCMMLVLRQERLHHAHALGCKSLRCIRLSMVGGWLKYIATVVCYSKACFFFVECGVVDYKV